MYDICGDDKYGSIIANCFITTNSNGINIVQCECHFKHNLQRGDNITVFYKDDNGWQKYRKQIKVLNIGNNVGGNNDKIFSIRYDDIASIYHYFEKSIFKIKKIWFKH